MEEVKEEIKEKERPKGEEVTSNQKEAEGASKEEDLVSKVEELSAKVKELEKERDEYKDRLLRLQAEFNNYLKRTRREMEEFRERAHEGVICDVLYILDNIERALEAAEKGADRESLLEGMKLIHKQFKEVLNRFGVEEVKALNCKFDPNFHQAVMKVEGNDKEKDEMVLQEIEKGYLLKGKLLRPSKVVVCKYRPPESGEDGKEQVRSDE